jgi:hypothetical protein
MRVIISHYGGREELRSFVSPPLETAIQSIDYVEIRPIGQIVKDGPIEFNNPGNTYNYCGFEKF